MRKISQDEFIKRLVGIFGDYFDYSLAIYTDSHTPVEVVCKRGHHTFPLPFNLLRGHGCHVCARENQKKLIYGVGINDLTNAKRTKAYQIWMGMLTRCYNPRYHQIEPTYTECTVCMEWRYLSNFKRWFEDPANGYREGYQLDKDLLVKGNKVYSPETCCFIPQEFNKMLITQKSRRGDLPMGVCARDGKFQARFGDKHRRKHLGLYDTAEEAFNSYKKAKEQYVNFLAEKYYKEGKITERVYLALLAYKVEITD